MLYMARRALCSMGKYFSPNGGEQGNQLKSEDKSIILQQTVDQYKGHNPSQT